MNKHSIFIAEFTIAKLWKQARCPAADEWANVVQHNGILFSHKEE